MTNQVRNINAFKDFNFSLYSYDMIGYSDLIEMRKQRKMGHITIVGPSMNTVKTRLDLLLDRENVGDQAAGFLYL